MALQSMTGFARVDASSEFGNWTWELRSVNGKGLDIRSRFPSGMEEMDADVRKMIGASLKRGNVNVSLQFQKSSVNERLVINEPLAENLWEAASSLKGKFGGEMPSIAELMNMRGVVEILEVDLSDQQQSKRKSEILETLERAVGELTAEREREGAAISAVLMEQVKQIEDLRKGIDQNEARNEANIREKLASQVKQLVDPGSGLDEQRIHQEAAILATKADLQEEIDRLKVHVTSALEMLSGDGPIGRKMDFLAQEFNRECNTICSKSNDAGITTLGLDMKIVIDQFREQIQNME